AIRIAVDMVRERLISRDEALRRVEPEQLSQLLRPIFDAREKERTVQEKRLIARGLNAGPGAASGRVVFNAEDAERRAAAGEPVILVRIETSPEDIGGMNAAQGILTARGGMTSHAALVARQMGKVCVAGCEALLIDYKARAMRIAGRGEVVREGDFVSLDGSTGEVFLGQIATTPSEVVRVLIERTLAPAQAPVYRLYAQLMKWADQARRLGVRARARRGAARVQPDARLPRLPSRHHPSRDHRDAGAGDLRGGGRGASGGHPGGARDHDPAGRAREGARPPGRGRAPRRRGGDAGERHAAPLPGRDHDRDPARRAHRRRDRGRGRVLLL